MAVAAHCSVRGCVRVSRHPWINDDAAIYAAKADKLNGSYEEK